jgi:hypothetical protein
VIFNRTLNKTITVGSAGLGEVVDDQLHWNGNRYTEDEVKQLIAPTCADQLVVSPTDHRLDESRYRGSLLLLQGREPLPLLVISLDPLQRGHSGRHLSLQLVDEAGSEPHRGGRFRDPAVKRRIPRRGCGASIPDHDYSKDRNECYEIEHEEDRLLRTDKQDGAEARSIDKQGLNTRSVVGLGSAQFRRILVQIVHPTNTRWSAAPVRTCCDQRGASRAQNPGSSSNTAATMAGCSPDDGTDTFGWPPSSGWEPVFGGRPETGSAR